MITLSYLIMACCSLASSSRCRTITAMIIFLSSSVRWLRSGSSGIEGGAVGGRGPPRGPTEADMFSPFLGGLVFPLRKLLKPVNHDMVHGCIGGSRKRCNPFMVAGRPPLVLPFLKQLILPPPSARPPSLPPLPPLSTYR